MAKSLVVSGLVVIALGSGVARSQDLKPLRSRASEQTQLSLTVYSNGRSMVRDQRKVNFEKGRFTLEFQDVSAQMRSETAQFKTLGSTGDVHVLEQNLEFDLLSPQKMLEKYLGKTVSVIRTHPTQGTETSEPAEVLSVQNGLVLKMKDRVETGIPGRIAFGEVPANMRAEPTLSLLVESRKRGERDVELNYLTDGMTWKADYIAEVNPSEDKTQLTGLVTLTNQTGTNFRNSQLQLMGGDVQTVDRDVYSMRKSARSFAVPMAAMDSESAPEKMSSDAFFEYHLYTLPYSTSILTNQTKQVTLFQASDVQSRKELVFVGGQNYFSAEPDFLPEGEGDEDQSPDAAELGAPVAGGVFLVFENDKESKLGLPLPAGVVRVYKKDKQGLSQFIGEDKIKHIPENERVRVRLGSSFDVTARRKQTSFKNLPPSSSNAKKLLRVIESGAKVTFKNAKNTQQKIIYREVIPGEWKIVSSSAEYKKISKDNAEWQLTVPAKGQVKIDFRVQVTLRR